MPRSRPRTTSPGPPWTGPYDSGNGTGDGRRDARRPDWRRAAERVSSPSGPASPWPPHRDTRLRPIAGGAAAVPQPVRAGCGRGPAPVRLRNQGGHASPGGSLRAATDRRHVRAPAGHDRRGTGDPRPQSRWGHPVRPRHADVRHHRRRRVDAARLRRFRWRQGRDDGSAARHRSRPGGQEHRQPDGHDPCRRLPSRVHEGRGFPPGLKDDLRSGSGDCLRRHPDRRPGRSGLDERLHRRSHPPGQDQDRSVERTRRHRTLRYLALGDSYTIGTGASDESHSWPSIIARRLNAELTNPSVNGYTTLALIRDELPYLERIKPDLVSILIGVNDLVQGRPPDLYRDSLTRIYDAVRDLEIPPRVAAISIPTWSYVPAAAGL